MNAAALAHLKGYAFECLQRHTDLPEAVKHLLRSLQSDDPRAALLNKERCQCCDRLCEPDEVHTNAYGKRECQLCVTRCNGCGQHWPHEDITDSGVCVDCVHGLAEEAQ